MKKLIEKVRSFYEQHGSKELLSETPRLITEFVKKEIAFIKSYPWKNKSVLEVGCGDGRLTKILAQKGAHVIGIDYSPVQLKKADAYLKDTKNISLQLMDATALSLPDDYFDVVVCFNATFGNMPTIETRALTEMKRVAKKQGLIIITVFSEEAREAQFQNYTDIGFHIVKETANTIMLKEGLYSRRFSEKDLTRIFFQAGLACSIKKLSQISYVAIAKKR